MMPISAPGNRRAFLPVAHRARWRGIAPRLARGFTLIELMIVITLVGLASGLVVMSLRDPAQSQLEQEAARLAAVLESARAESRMLGLPVIWVPGRAPDAPDDAGDFRFVGLPRSVALPTRFLDRATTAEVAGGAKTLTLGPEPLIGAHRIVLRLGSRRLDVVTDGMGPFGVPGDDAQASTAADEAAR